MNTWLKFHRAHAALAGGLDRLQSPFLLGTRLWVSWQFLKSGWLKLTTWDTTLELFSSEYHVPVLPPAVFTRAGALGLFAVNLMAVVSYWHVLGGEGFEAALGQHVLWGFMLGLITIFGAGRISIDALINRG
jgi:putative oxidoreductase